MRQQTLDKEEARYHYAVQLLTFEQIIQQCQQELHDSTQLCEQKDIAIEGLSGQLATAQVPLPIEFDQFDNLIP